MNRENIATEERPCEPSADGAQGTFEDFLMHLAIAFVNILPENIDREINRALAMTGMFTGVDRAYVMTYNFRDRTVANTHEWCADGIEPMIHELQCIPMQGLEEDWLDVHLRGEIVHVPSVKDLPASGALRQLLEPQGISTLVAVPMSYREKCLGFVGFDAVRHHVEWSKGQLTLVRMLGELFTNAEMSRRRTQAIHEQRAKHKRMSLLLQKAVDATGIAVWELARNAKTVNMISGWDRLVGGTWDGTEIELDEFQSRVHPEDIPRVEAVVSGHGGEHTQSKGLEFRLRGKRGDWRYLRAWWVEEPFGSHDQVKLYGGTMDVSDIHLRSESQLLLNRISSRFVDLESHEEAIAQSMPEIARFCLASSAELILASDVSRKLYDNRHESSSSKRDQCVRVWNPTDSTNKIHSHLSSGNSVVIGKDGSIKSLRTHGAGEIQFGQDCKIWMPLMVGGEAKAVIVLTDPDFGNQSDPPHLDFLRGCAEVIAGALGRTEAEKALLENGKRKQVILNSLNEVIFLTDTKGRITFINQAGADFCGQPVTSLIGRYAAELLNSLVPTSIGFFPSTLLDLVESEESMICSTRQSGRSRTLRLVRRLLKDDTSTITGILGMISDITEQEAWESNLISQKIQAESSSKEKTLYISNLSHELRTPMHGVLGMLDLIIKSGKLDPENYEFAQSASRSGNDLLRIFDDLLQIAKLESGVVKIAPNEVELRRMMEDTLLPFCSECANRNIDLAFNLSRDIPERIFIDDLRFRQIINNLVSNAIKYTDEGAVCVTIELEEYDGQERRMCLEVKDTGIGITKEDMGLLFTPFVKIQSHRNRHVEGSGLGLSITHGLVTLLDGEITIDSKIGEGTSVKVFLPLTTCLQHPSLREDFNTKNNSYHELKDLSVLVAEDNEINRILISAHLESMGCLVTNARNGMEAVSACVEQFFDVVIMDLSMPVMHGFEAAKQILQNAITNERGTVIIGCTADASEHTTSRCLDVGMRSVIVKPFTRDELAFAIKSHVVGSRQNSGSKPKTYSMHDTHSSAPHFNIEVFESLERNISSDHSDLYDIIYMFCDDSLRMINEIISNLDLGNDAQCAAIAHSLKGSSASVGADLISHYCALIEEACLAPPSIRGSEKVLPEDIGEKLFSAHAEYRRLIAERRNKNSAPRSS